MYEDQTLLTPNQNSQNRGNGYIVYLGLRLGPQKIFTKNSISINAGTLHWYFTVEKYDECCMW